MNVGARRRAGAGVGALVAASLALSGCWSAAPVEQVGLVTLMAIDPGPKHQLEVTVSIDMPTTSSASPGLGQTAAALVRRASGRTLQEAIGHLRTDTFLTLGFDHLEALFVSEAVARAGLARALGDITTSPEFVSTAYLLVSPHGPAGAIIDHLQSAKPRPEVVVTNTINQARSHTAYLPNRLYDFLKRVQIPGDAFTTTGAFANPAEGQGATAALQIRGQAVFDRDRLAGWLGEPQALGWMLATGKAGHPVFEVTAGQGGFGLQIASVHRAVHVTPAAPAAAAEVDISVHARLVGAQGVPSAWWSDPQAVTTLATAAAATLTGDVLTAVQTAQADSADVFGLGEFVRIADPAAWDRLGAEWDRQGFRHMPVRARVKVTLDNLGNLVCPPFEPCGRPAVP